MAWNTQQRNTKLDQERLGLTQGENGTFLIVKSGSNFGSNQQKS
jgi:hypothetical protein